MKVFRQQLAQLQTKRSPRRWTYVAYDQLNSALGDLATAAPEDVGIVLVEAPAKAARRPYHKQKLAWVLTQQRHFALEQAARGVAVRYIVAPDSYAAALAETARELGPLRMMRPAERELRNELAPLVASRVLEEQPHTGWLSTREDFLAAVGNAPPWRMDVFYKYMRKRSGFMMRAGKPEGGKFSFDADNRRAWRGDPPAPQAPSFSVDDITEEVGSLLREQFAAHHGELRLERIPATLGDIEDYWRWVLRACLPHFGPFEDAMSTLSPTLFHSCISPLLNLHRLTPAAVVKDVVAATDAPLESREGFLRQVLGWREFVRHVHEETDGFRRDAAGGALPTMPAGDGGYGRWRGAKWPQANSAGDDGAAPSTLEAHEPVPPAYWGKPSGLACLDQVTQDVLRDGYSHHITRLMVLSNLGTLVGMEPRELTDWFWVNYIDAYDWVVEPNVLAMGTYAVGDVMTTKPYVSGAAYIHKMSDYCKGCAFDPKKDCPITRLYWAFLARHRARFARNPRTAGPIASLTRRTDEEQREDLRTLALVRASLREGKLISPASLRKKDPDTGEGTLFDPSRR